MYSLVTFLTLKKYIYKQKFRENLFNHIDLIILEIFAQL